MSFLVRLRSPRSDQMSLSCTSGAPRTHVVLSRAQLHKAPQPLTYSRTLVCADGVNAEVLLRFARNELFERAQQANRHVTALVDEEYVCFSHLLRPRGLIRTHTRLIYHTTGGNIPSGRSRVVIIVFRCVTQLFHPYLQKPLRGFGQIAFLLGMSRTVQEHDGGSSQADRFESCYEYPRSYAYH